MMIYIFFAILALMLYLLGKTVGRIELINELSGKGLLSSKDDWDGRLAREKMFTEIWNGIRRTYYEENIPTGLATFHREAIWSILSTNEIKMIDADTLKKIISDEIDYDMADRHRVETPEK